MRQRRFEDLFESGRMRGEEGPVEKVFLDDDGDESGQQPGIGTGTHLKVDVRELCGLGSPRVDHDHLARRVFGDFLERDSSLP